MEINDWVEIISGKHKGSAGFIVEVQGEYVEVGNLQKKGVKNETWMIPKRDVEVKDEN